MKAPDRRSEKREPKAFLVRYSGSADLEGKSATFVRFAATINVSPSGLCFRSPIRFEASHRLDFLSDDLWEEGRVGEVRWCEQTESGIYIVGVSLTRGADFPIYP